MKLHLHTAYPTLFGGMSSGATLCGRRTYKDPDGTNNTVDIKKVTCKFCLKIMADPLSWRWRRHVKYKV